MQWRLILLTNKANGKEDIEPSTGKVNVSEIQGWNLTHGIFILAAA